MPRYQSTAYPEVRFWCLQTLAEAVRSHHASLSDQDAAALRAHVASWIHDAATRTDPATAVPAFIKNKLAQVCARLAGAEYPARWPSFFADLLQLAANAGDGGLDALVRVLDAVDDEVISSGDTQHGHGAGSRGGNSRRGGGGADDEVPASTRVKDAMRAEPGLLPRIVDAIRAVIASGLERATGPGAALAEAAAGCARRYAEWVDVSLFSDEAFVRTINAMLASGHHGLRGAGCDFLVALAHKGMDHGAKVGLIARLDLVNVSRVALNAYIADGAAASAAGGGGGDNDDATEGEGKAAALAAAVGGELLSCLRAEAASAAGAEANEPHAPPPPRDACDAAARMVDDLMPTAVSALGSRRESTTMSILPLATAYVNRLKDAHAVKLMPASSAAVAEGTLRASLDAVVRRSSFPDESAVGVDFGDGDDKSTRECEADAVAMRQELAVLFRAIARLAPHLALGAVRGALARALSLEGGGGEPVRWQTVETALAALHLVGEGARDGAVKPGVEESPLGELVEMLLGAWDVLGSKSPAVAAHRLVAPALLEICVRYHLAVERRPALLRPALAAFLDGRGVMHPAREVSRRACYLFCRFVKPTRGLILCHGALPGVMAALEPALMDASVPEFATSSAASSVGSSFTGGGTGGAMATAGNDDRLYVFEAFGLLLGIDDVPDDLRIRCLEAVFARLRGAVEAASNSHSPANQNPAAAQHAIVAMGNVAKGFTLRVATQTSPRVGEILASGLDPALRCVQLWPRDPLTRQRVVAYFQRLVTVVGPAVFPYASPLLEHMRSVSPSASKLRECLVLINQLMASFKESLAPFLATQLPPLVTQIAGALAPFAAPGGGVNGVCGLFLDGARRVNPRLVPNDDGGSGGANAAGGAVVGAAGNTEEAREARDLEKIFVAHAHGVAANNLAGVLVADPRLRECFLETLAAAASAHPSAMSRKSALQALIRVAQCWLPTAEVVASGGATRAGEGPVPGFAAFAVSRVAKEACVDAVMRGDLDPRDAGCAAAVAETVNFTRVMLERLGDEFANHLRVNLLGAAWGLDPESHGREYVRRVTSTTQNSAREARAFIAECAKIAQGKNPGLASKKCTPGM